MLTIWNSADKLVRPAVRMGIGYNPNYPFWWALNLDPLFRHLGGRYDFIVPLDPVPMNQMFNASYPSVVGSTEITRSPENFKVKDKFQYDDQHYGSFADSLQSFARIFRGETSMDPPHQMHSQHYVRHKTFKGKAISNSRDLKNTSYDVDWFGTNLSFPGYTHPIQVFSADSSESVVFESNAGYSPVFDITPLLDELARKNGAEDSYEVNSELIEATITWFRYRADSELSFDYGVRLLHHIDSFVYTHTYSIYYKSGPPRKVDHYSNLKYFATGSLYGLRNHVHDEGDFNREFDASGVETSIMTFPMLPVDDEDANVAPDGIISARLQTIALPFWKDVESNWWDVTALSRDTATVALNRLADQSYDSDFGRLSSITPLKVAGESLLATTADAALGDFQRDTVKSLLKRFGGSTSLVRFRTIFSDLVQLADSLEVLGSLRRLPSRQYVASAHFDYPIVLGGRDCVIHVRSKAYLVLSPFRLLQILIGKQYVAVLIDALDLYYHTHPLGEILLTVLQLRKVGDVISNRMFYDLPLYFVHVYEVESQLTQAEMDYTGISAVTGNPVRLVYYGRDISRYLPVLRFSNLASFYGTGDVGNVVWTLLQQLVGVLSSGA